MRIFKKFRRCTISFVRKFALVIYPYIYFFIRKKPKLSVQEAEIILANHSADPGTSPICKNIVCSPENAKYDLTVIVPAYNVEKYIEKCIDSIIKQKTKYKIHVKVVNDGSTDRTAEFLNKYMNEFNITIITQENQGFSGARNTALRNISSRYIMFVDSDDFVREGSLDALLDTAYNDNADIVQGGMEYTENNGIEVISNRKFLNKKNVPSEALLGFPVGKVFKSSLFENISFPEKYWFEDIIISHLIFPFSKKNSTIENIVYSYRKNSEGISHTSRGKAKSIDTFWVTRMIVNARSELGLITDNDYYQKLLGQIRLNFKRTIKEPDSIKRAIFVLSRELVLEQKKAEISVDKKYVQFERTLLKNDFGGYSFLGTFLK